MQWRRHVAGFAFCFVFVVSCFTNKMADVRRGRPAPALRKAGVGGAEPHQQVRGAALDPSLPPVCGEHICRFQGLVSHRHPLFLHAPELLSRRQPRDPEGRPRTEDAAAEVDQHMSPAAFGHQPPPLRPEVRLRRLPVGRWSPALRRVLLLAAAAHPTGDLVGALEFPSLQSHTFHCGCCASALLGFLLLLATVKLKSGLSQEHFGIWNFLSKVTAMSLSPFIFSMDSNAPSLMCVVISHAGEALLVYSDREPQL
ncbi:uncharacterized protein LOC120790148 isoform X12 [Xiphias gladius]|uniref:uncharacterized protein LOC120790148 isoform X12 n=1 Tax=Xiphias gladius TaxID=8245 RepID=UPI001A988FBF|nr:uncharacterized protein LOC120790148 isoform X12 [Xiphias gladius]